MPRQMKDSGVEWIGQIPTEWDIRKIKKSFAIYAGATPKSENNEFFDGEIVWVTPADYKTADKYVSNGRRNLSDAGYKSCGTTLVPKGSVIFSKRAPIGSVAIASQSLCTNQGCLACVPIKENDSTYFYYAMSVFTDEFNLMGTGTTFKEISANAFANFELPYPQPEMQKRISDFLDAKCSHIDSVLEQTRASIEEYKKLKQVMITQAVTKGVHQERSLKDGGISWLTQIPEEWRVERGKNLFVETKELSNTGEEELLTVSHITGVTPRSEKNVNMFMAESLVGYKICHEGDLAANTMWMWQGAIGVSKYEGVISPSYNTYRQRNNEYVSDYLEYLLRIPPLVATYAAYSTGITASRLRLYPDQFFSILFPIPPRDEQIDIVSYLNGKIPEMDKLIQKKEQFLVELENYKKSMIYEYVTGKKEVPQS